MKVPPRFEYTLTELGSILLVQLHLLSRFTAENLNLVAYSPDDHKIEMLSNAK